MGISVLNFDGRQLAVGKALAPNVNVHGSAFAGSQFSVASLCGWGQVYLQLALGGQHASIVFVEGTIRCLKPVRDDVTARCQWNAEAAATLEALAASGRTRVRLDVTLESGGQVAAEFSGEYGLRAGQ